MCGAASSGAQPLLGSEEQVAGLRAELEALEARRERKRSKRQQEQTGDNGA